MKTICVLSVAVIMFALFTGCGKDSKAIAEPPDPVDPAAYNHIYKSGEGGYYCFRIPALIRTKSGTLLAFAEARKNNCGDEGDIDLVVKRSSDKGLTWSALSIVWDDAANTCGNPAPVVDERDGKIHLLMTWNLGTDDISTINNGTSADTRRVYKTASTDDGKTWSPAAEITSSVKRAGWGWYATGPCHGIQLKQGVNAGRMIIPCDYIEVGAGRKGYSHVIYSDDAGVSWKIGGVTPAISLSPNESTVAELSNGKLMLNMRVANNNNLRMKSLSSDGGLSWTSPVPALTLVDPVCQGSLLSTTQTPQAPLIFSNPSSITRTNITMKMSTDLGETWSRFLTIYTGPSAYSDLVEVEANKIGILYEAGVARFSDGIAYRNVLISELK